MKTEKQFRWSITDSKYQVILYDINGLIRVKITIQLIIIEILMGKNTIWFHSVLLNQQRGRCCLTSNYNPRQRTID